jgi:microcystin-dependent protein
MSYTSKYTGQEIDNLLDVVETSGQETVIWEGVFTNTNQTIQYIELNDSIANYNYIAFYLTVTHSGQNRYLYKLVNSEFLTNFFENETQDVNCISFNWGFSDRDDYIDILKGSTTTSLKVKSYKITPTKIVGIKKSILSEKKSDSTPVGTIISLMGLRAPDGYLVCDGSEIEISKHERLANYFEEQFGTKNYFGGNGSTTFAVPDLRNEFLRGYGELSNEIGMHQDATEIPHVWIWNSSATSGSLGPNVNVNKDNIVDNADILNMDMVSDTVAQRSYIEMGSAKRYSYTKEIDAAVDGGSRLAYSYTARPTNIAVLYCIKY